MKKPYCLVVIPFKNKADLVINCVNSILNSYISGFNYYIILISDGSEETEIEKIEKTYNNLVPVIRREQLGYTKQIYDIVNEIKCLTYDYILICNNDILFFHNTFTNLVNILKTKVNCACVGCKVLYWDNDIIAHTGVRINNKFENSIENPYVGLNMNDPKTNGIERRLWVNGCCSIYNLDILRKENLNFSLDFMPAYFEESDLQTELNLRGYSVLYNPTSIVRHLINGTTRDDSIYCQIFENNWKLYLNKWKPYFNSKMLTF